MAKESTTTATEKVSKCGIVMPISKHPDYPDSHWNDVFKIIESTVLKAGLTPTLVSDDPAIGVIHERIISNLYDNELVICDVSSLNPNVMFELGIRLAFDKATIIIKDEKTDFSFDAGVIEHIPYPSSLRFPNVISFQEALLERINGTLEKARSDPEYSPFLKSFGRTIVPAKIKGKEITQNEFIIQTLLELKQDVGVLKRSTSHNKLNNIINSINTSDNNDYSDFRNNLNEFRKVRNTIDFGNKIEPYNDILNSSVYTPNNSDISYLEKITKAPIQGSITIENVSKSSK